MGTGNGDDRGPLSFQQEEMVRVLRTFPECDQRYDMVCVFVIEGPLDVEGVLAAVGDLVQRHGLLRTTIEAGSTADAQRVHPTPVGEIAHRPILGRMVDDVVAELIARRLRAAQVLAGEPLFRAQVIEIDSTRHLLALKIHHLLYDGLSLPILWRDLAELYAARRERRRDRLPPLPVSYVEYARSQRKHWPALAERAMPFWQRVVNGAPQGIAWPRPTSSSDRTYETDLSSFLLSPSEVDVVTALARDVRVSPFLVLLAATIRSFARVTGQDDLLVGTDFAHREALWKRDLVGHCLNTRLTRARIDGGQPFVDLVLAVRESWLTAEEYRDAYLDRIIQALGIPWLTPVMMEPPGLLRGPDLPGLAVTPVPVKPPYLYWRELMVTWHPREAGFAADILYRPSCVDSAAVEAVAKEVHAILRDPLRQV